MIYRKDIQVLRGVAVSLVVLFHLGIAGFNSGFLGVDVFFVISGFLMAMMYDPSRIAEFFSKRARRLLPAYFAVVILTLLATALLTNPIDYRQVLSQSVFASFFASNVGFWIENSYFDKTAFKPLLHLWSLGVEIQFYLMTPLIFWIYNKTKVGYLAIFVASAALCFIVVGVSPKTSFFWLPFRLWEFLLGFGIAKYANKVQSISLLSYIGFASLISVVGISLFNTDGQAPGFMVGHPGFAALLICLATAATLTFGIPPQITANPLSRLLEIIGGYSYSIYLAHFPIIVLFHYEPFSGTVMKPSNMSQTVIVVLLVTIASLLCFKLIEEPSRTKIRKPLLWILSAVVTVLSIGYFGSLIKKVQTPHKEMLIYEALDDRDVYRCGKFERIINPTAISCEITRTQKDPSRRVFLVGNSHADSIKHTFKDAANARNVAVFFLVENMPLMDGGITPKELIIEAQSRRIDSIVLHYSPGAIDVKVIKELVQLANERQIEVAFLMPIPVWDINIVMALLNNANGSVSIPSQTMADYISLNKELIVGLATIPQSVFKIYQSAQVFCGVLENTDKCKLISEHGKPLYFDSNHLSLTGSLMLRNVFDKLIEDLF